MTSQMTSEGTLTDSPSSRASRWADVFGRQNRGVKSHFFSGPPGQKTVLLHRHCIANQGVTGNDEYLLDQRLDEGPTLGQFTLL